MPGFLGPRTELAADLNLVVQAVLILALTGAMFLARRRRTGLHCRLVTPLALVNLAAILLLMLPAAFTARGRLTPPLEGAWAWLFPAHALLGAMTEAMALYILARLLLPLPRRGEGLRLGLARRYRRHMEVVGTLWPANFVLGLAAYWALYWR